MAAMESLQVVIPLVLIAAVALIVLIAVRKFQARRVQDDLDALDLFDEEEH